MATPPEQVNTPDPLKSLPPLHRYDSSLGALRAFLFGRALPTARAAEEKLPKLLALPIFASNGLSSVAYATEAILTVLVASGIGALPLSLPISGIICLLIVIVGLSYRQIIFAYPNGGGAYPVSKENLGTLASLVAAGALLVDYILTVAVSIASGVDALSFAGPWVHQHSVDICLLSVLVITLANLRGVRESGALFALPTYLFILGLAVVIVLGGYQLLTGHAHIHTPQQVDLEAIRHGLRTTTMAVGFYLLLQAFSSGCAALTGMEVISNTVPVFREPRDKNAAKTMVWLTVLSVVLFYGIAYLAVAFRALPIPESAPDYQTVLSQIAHRILSPTPLSWFFYVVQFATAIVLVLAANTAFAGFPHLASMLARDRFLPHQLASIGDRLVYANGIVVLAFVSAALIFVFKGDLYALIPLYAVGVFVSFTLAQTGLVLYWRRLRDQHWHAKAFLNGLGAASTAVVAVVLVVSKWSAGAPISAWLVIPTDGVWQITANGMRLWPLAFYRHWQFVHPGQTLSGFTIGPGLTPHYGAWMVAALIPILVSMFQAIHAHYMDVRQQLNLEDYRRPHRPSRHVVIVLVPGLNRGVVDALDYAQMISPDCRAVYVEIDETATPRLKSLWEEWSNDIPLLVLASRYRSLIGPVRRYIDAVQREREDDIVTVVLPEFVSTKWWHALLHNQAGLLLKLSLLNRPGIIVTNVRYFLKRPPRNKAEKIG